MSVEDPKADARWALGLEGLLDAERANEWAPAGAEDRAWGRLTAALPGALAVKTSQPAARPALGSLPGRLGLYLAGVLTGVVGALVVMHPRATESRTEAPVPVASAEREIRAEPLVPALTTAADASPAPRATPAQVALAQRPAASSDHSLEAERVLLDDARAGLGRGNGAGALRATALHAERYPSGFLAEEREAIAIQALLLVARYDDARQREAAFERQYPHSMLLQAVRASLESIP